MDGNEKEKQPGHIPTWREFEEIAKFLIGNDMKLEVENHDRKKNENPKTT